MPVYDANSAQCFVYTFKEGLLSRFGHDLKLRFARFRLERPESDAGDISAEFFLDSLEVLSARREGRDDPTALSARDKADIAKRMKGVLQPDRYPTASFQGRAQATGPDTWSIDGALQWRGREQRLVLHARKTQNAIGVEGRFDQRLFGIEPYRAPLGALKLQAEVEVEVVVPLS